MAVDKEYKKIRAAAIQAAEEYETLVAELIPQDRAIEFIRALDNMILTRDKILNYDLSEKENTKEDNENEARGSQADGVSVAESSD